MYYNVTRYYNPEWGRFLNADDVSYLDPSSINGLNLFAYCGNNPIMRIDPYGNAWYHWVIGGIVAVAIVAVAIGTAGAIVAAAPAIAGYLGTAAISYTGSAALAGAAATVVSIGAAVLAVGTITIGINEGINIMTGTNLISSAIGQEAYGITSTLVGMGGYMYIMGGMTLPYPSTGRTEPNNLKEQMVMGGAKENPSTDTAINRIKMSDARMPSWLGWQKYSYRPDGSGIDVHYVGNRFFPKWHPLQPWFDFKFI